jgi:RNA polymerase sigma-70 factor (ECF subfamily)
VSGEDCDADRATSNMTLPERTVNGEPGLVVQHDGVASTVLTFAVVGGVIKNN